MTTHTLGIGSNAPDRRLQMDKAYAWLCSRFKNVERSEVYSTPALNGVDADYCNMVARITADIDTDELISLTKHYETGCGRTHEKGAGQSVVIDIDVVMANDTVLRPADFEREYFRRGYLQLKP